MQKRTLATLAHFRKHNTDANGPLRFRWLVMPRVAHVQPFRDHDTSNVMAFYVDCRGHAESFAVNLTDPHSVVGDQRVGARFGMSPSREFFPFELQESGSWFV